MKKINNDSTSMDCDFSYYNAKIINVPIKLRGYIKEIWLEDMTLTSFASETSFDEDDSISLSTAKKALLIFHNDIKLVISNSEWCSLNLFK